MGFGSYDHVALFQAQHTAFSHDFFWQAQNLKLYCKVRGIDRVAATFQPHGAFKPVPGMGFIELLDGVMRPFLHMLGIDEVNSKWTDIEIREYNMSTWVEAYRKHGWLPYRPAPRITAAGYEGCITITLREALHQPSRNSNIMEWLKVARWLEGQGRRVVILRDTAKANERLDGFETCPKASMDMEYRVALYYAAGMNLFTANGSSTILLATPDVPYLTTLTTAAVALFEELHRDFYVMHIDDLQPQGYRQTDQWQAWFGMPRGGQIAWANPKRQRFVWGDDTAGNIIAALSDMEW